MWSPLYVLIRGFNSKPHPFGLFSRTIENEASHSNATSIRLKSLSIFSLMTFFEKCEQKCISFILKRKLEKKMQFVV